MRKTYTLLTLTVMFVLFQNFEVIDIAFDERYTVNERVRSAHAKEILGRGYEGSNASKLEGEMFLNVEILNLVRRSLPKKHEKKAEKITKAILEQSKKYSIDPVFVVSIIRTESGFNPDAVGSVGELGLMQLKPKTGEYIAKRFKIPYKDSSSLRDPVRNIQLGVAYFSYLREKFKNHSYRYIAAYNSGPGVVAKVSKRGEVPKIYSDKVLRFYESFYRRIFITQTLKNPYRI